MAQPKSLTQAQVDLLRWIAEGCADGVYEGDRYKISAAALRNRGLVRTKGHGSSWKASITKDGRKYLDSSQAHRHPSFDSPPDRSRSSSSTN